ncbi:MAG: type II secretion system F family protein [Eubacteriales bacterium]|nr:type II secretion system F family protein [Eubacteriales bacterium]
MKKLTNEMLSQFCEQFSMILSSGMSSLEGLHIMKGDSLSPKSQAVYDLMCQEIEEHGSLSRALSSSRLFPEDMIAYVAMGEETGSLDNVMKDLSEHYEQEADTERTIRSAVTHPLLMLLMMGTVIVILLVKVLPVFSQVFHQMGLQMNGVSLKLLRAGTVLRTYSVVFVILALLLLGMILFFLFHPKGKANFRRLLMRLPYFHRIPEMQDLERFSQGIAMGLHAALSPEHGMELASRMASTPNIRKASEKALSMLNEGCGFAEALTESGLYSGIDKHMIDLSFQTGSTDLVLSRIAHRAHEESNERIQKVVRLIEPAMVLILGIMTGLVLLSVMLPLFGLLTQMTA